MAVDEQAAGVSPFGVRVDVGVAGRAGNNKVRLGVRTRMLLTKPMM